MRKFSKDEISEIRTTYIDAKNKDAQIGILAELHAVDKKTIVGILQGPPENLLGPGSTAGKGKISGYGASKKAAYAVLGGMSREEVMRQYDITDSALRASVDHYRKQYKSEHGEPEGTPVRLPAENPAAKPAAPPEKHPAPAGNVILDRTVTAAISYTGCGGLQVNGVPLKELFDTVFDPLMDVDGLVLFAGRLHIRIENISEGRLIPERIGPAGEEKHNEAT